MTIDYITRESGIAVPGFANVQLRERIAELEFAAEDSEWLLLGTGGDSHFEFSRRYITTLTRLARLTYLKNPIVGRGVRVKADYVFGRQVSIKAKDEDINAVIQAFLDDPRNQNEFTSQAARIEKERELQTDGNIFFVLIPHMQTGAVRIRSLDVDEITDIITNPDDRKEAWYYKREYTAQEYNFDRGEYVTAKRTAYYRDWRYAPKAERKTIGEAPVIEGQYIYHIKVGGFSNWKFGISEIYSAIDWSKAYKTFLENWSTIVAAYARFAFKVTTTGGKPAVQAATKRLSTTASTTSGENNPKPTTASTFVSQEGTSIDPIRTAGATTSADDGRRLLLMVCAAFGLPETFFGDVSVGTLATAESLDRPTELMIANRQVLWIDIYHDILAYVLDQAVLAIDGPLRAFADISVNEYGDQVVIFDKDTIDTHIDIDFPGIVEVSTKDKIGAIVSGATFDGKTPSILNDKRMLARMILQELGENDIDELIDAMYNEDGSPKFEEPKPVAPVLPGTVPPAVEDEDPLAENVRILRQAIEDLREALYPSDRRVFGTVGNDPLAPKLFDPVSGA